MKKIVLAGAIPDALRHALSASLPVSVFDGVLTDPDSIAAALADADALIYAPPIPDVHEAGRTIGDLLRGGYQLFKAASENAATRRVVLLSTLRFFARMPQNWRVHTGWRPRPSTDPSELMPYLTECSVRELTRASGRFNASGGLHTTVLRLNPETDTQKTVDFLKASLEKPYPEHHSCSFRILHAGDIEGRPPATGAPFTEVLAPTDPIPSRPLRRVVLFGAAGPVQAATAQELARDYVLRLSDVRTMAEVRADGKRQSPFAPLPVPPEELPPSRFEMPHDEFTLDIADPDAVLAACADGDAILNGSVLRHEPVAAFRVNAQGVYNLCRAAVAHRIRRLVQTGPLQTQGHSEDDYSWDWAVDNPPARPGRSLYAHSKYLGQEIARVFAENHDLSVPNLLYTQFVSPEARPGWGSAMLVTWDDSARALRAALEVSPEQLGSPYEEFQISVTVPQDTFRYDRARRILGWTPQDDLSYLWQEPTDA
ncbi:MAG: NAD-dependent epimerase/dehydratase family protein [Capsulimonadales bacterium]|nr:NAD-dependent epimerase/dehydratase family protein [Capsulimonadales bacterium]